MADLGDPAVTQDERTYATLAHALQTVGWWIAPLVIFLVKRESKFVKFHALQALLLQCCLVILWTVIMVGFFASMFTSIATNPNSKEPPTALFIFFPIIWLLSMAGFAAVITLAIVYAIKAGRGQWARYPLLGGLAMRILGIAPSQDAPAPV